MGSKQSKISSNSSKNTNSKQAPPPPRSNRQNRMTKQAIIDEDDRQQLQQDKTLQFIGLIRGKFKSRNQTHIGTGAILTDDLVLTVAHNVCSINTHEFRRYRKHLENAISSNLAENRSFLTEQTVNEFKHAEFAQWLQFYPGLNGEVTGLQNLEDVICRQNKQGNFRRVKQFKVHPSFLTEHNHQMYDICLLQLDAPVKGQKIKILQNYTNITTQISVFGYPIDICFKEEAGKVTARQFGTKGRFKLDQQMGKITYRIATERGQSGSPIFINTTKCNNTQYFCIGVHSGGNPEICNVGIHLNDEKVKWLGEIEEHFTGRLAKITKINLFPRLPENNIPAKAGKDVKEKSLQDYENEIKMKEGSTSKQAIYLRREAALLCMGEQDYKRAIQHYQSFVALMQGLKEQQRNIDDQDEWQVALINLAKCYSQSENHLKSLSLYEVAQEKCREFFSLSAEKESVILNNKGAVMVKLQRFEQALEFFKRAHTLRVNKFGEESLMTYNSLQNLASVRLKLIISVNDSIHDYEKVFKFKQKKFGIGSKEAIMTKQNLAFALLQNGRYSEGLQSCHYCLQKLKGKDGEQQNNFLNHFTRQMRQLCRKECSLQDLKMAYSLCQQSGLSNLAQQIDNQWSKRNATNST